jgi:hypothetical protein
MYCHVCLCRQTRCHVTCVRPLAKKKFTEISVKWDVQHWGLRSLFLKQPDALPGRAPPKNIKIYFELLLIHLRFFINELYFLEFF